MAQEQPRIAGRFAPKSTPTPNGVSGIIPEIIGGKPQPDVRSGESVIDPTEIGRRADESRADEGKRGRGRPPGSGKKEEGKAAPKLALDVTSLNFSIYMVHELLAKATRCPEIAFDEKESETVGNAFMNVLRHYDVKPQQKATDWINLVMCLSIVYGGRYSKITSRHAQERKDKKAALAEQNAGAAPFGIVN